MVTASFALIVSSDLPHYAVRIMLGGMLSILAVLLIATPLHKRYHYTKKTFFSMISVIAISVTIALVFTHVSLISQSTTGSISKREGHLSIFACGQQISIAPSSRFSSTAGNGPYSIAKDGSMHYLGYEKDSTIDATLGSFFQAIGGSVSANVVTVPFNNAAKSKITDQTILNQFSRANPSGDTYLELRSGESCSVSPSMIGIYIYRFDPTTTKFNILRVIQHPEKYVISNQDYNKRDCVIVLFDNPSSSTKLTCQGYPALSEINSGVSEVSL